MYIKYLKHFHPLVIHWIILSTNAVYAIFLHKILFSHPPGTEGRKEEKKAGRKEGGIVGGKDKEKEKEN
jgi:hypothetical protein